MITSYVQNYNSSIADGLAALGHILDTTAGASRLGHCSTVSWMRSIAQQVDHSRVVVAWYCPSMTFPRTLKKYQTSFRAPLSQPRYTCAPCSLVSADWISLEV